MKKKSNKEKILEQVRQLIADGAFSEITIRGICEQAGVSIGSFYHYFQAKEDVIVELFRSNAQRARENERLNLTSADEWENLRAYVRFQISFLEETSLDRLQFLYAYNITHYQSDSLSQYRQIVRELLIRAAEKGQMKPEYAAQEVLDHLFTLILGNSIRYCMENGDYPIGEQLMKQVNHLITLIAA